MLKKYILIIVSNLFFTILFSQVRIGGNVGVGLQNTYYDTEDFSEMDPIFQPNLGVNFKMKISSVISLETGLQYMRRGFSYDFFRTESKFIMHYLDVPLNIVFLTFPEEGVTVHLGPVLNIALGGHSKSVITDNSTGKETTYREKASVGTSETTDSILPMSLGGSIGIGREMDSGLFYRINFNLMITSNNPERDVNTHPYGVGVNVGYFFNN